MTELLPEQLDACLTTTVPSEMLDYNGHLNAASFAVLFEKGATNFLAQFGLDKEYRTRTGHMVIMVESHIRFLREILPEYNLSISAQLLDVDNRHLRCMYHMHNDTTMRWAARQEVIYTHINAQTAQSIPFPGEQLRKLKAMQSKHQLLRRVDVGRQIQMLRSD